MAGQAPAFFPADRWHESVLSTRSLSYMSTISALGQNPLPSPLASRNASLAHLYARRPSTMDEDSEYELEVAGKRARVDIGLPDSVARSILFKLPREIREKIYKFCLIASDKPRTLIEWPKPKSFVVDIAPNLLRTCRIISSEASPFLYTGNSFTFHHPSDANIFVRCMSSPQHAHLLTSIQFHVRTQDNRAWMPYLTSNDDIRSLRRDFPNLRELVIRYRSIKWNHTVPIETNMRNWSDDKHLDEIIDGLRHVYHDPFKNIDTSDLSRQQVDVIREYEDADVEMQDSLRDNKVREKLREIRQGQAARLRDHTVLQIRVICMCRINEGHFEALTLPPPPPQHHHINPTDIRALSMRALQTLTRDVPTSPPAPVREGTDFYGFTAVDLIGRAIRVQADSMPGGASAWAARTVFLNRRNIMLALEVFTYDHPGQLVQS